jgi:hypothetical protein
MTVERGWLVPRLSRKSETFGNSANRAQLVSGLEGVVIRCI